MLKISKYLWHSIAALIISTALYFLPGCSWLQLDKTKIEARFRVFLAGTVYECTYAINFNNMWEELKLGGCKIVEESNAYYPPGIYMEYDFNTYECTEGTFFDWSKELNLKGCHDYGTNSKTANLFIRSIGPTDSGISNQSVQARLAKKEFCATLAESPSRQIYQTAKQISKWPRHKFRASRPQKSNYY